MSDSATRLSELLTDPARAAEIPSGEAVALLVELATLQVALLRAAFRPDAAPRHEAQRPDEDHMLQVDEAAVLLGVTRRWLYRHSRKLPFARPISAKVVRFSRDGIRRWLATRRT